MKPLRIIAFAGFILALGFAGLVAQDAGSVAITVVKGDTLNDICRAYLIDPANWPKIAAINRLPNPDLIYPGQKISVPVEYIGGFEDEGTVTVVAGEAVRKEKNKDNWAPLLLGDIVHSGDQLRTGADGGLVVAFASGNSLQMMSGVRLTVLVTKKIDEMNIFQRILLGVGKIITRVKEVTGRSSRFEVKTPSAVAAARGTVFRVGLDEEGTTRTETLQGRIGVEAQAVMEVVREGEGTLVRKDEPPQKSRTLLPPPAPLDPLAGDLIPPLSFRFSKVEGAVGYRVFLSRDAEGREIVREVSIRPEEAAEFKGEIRDGNYFLIAQSVDADGLEGLGSTPKPLRLGILGPLEPTAPVEGAILAASAVDILWPDAPRTGWYHIQIAQDADFRRLVVDRTDLAAAFFRTPSLKPGFYWLRASAVYGEGRESAFSAPRRFQLIGLPDAPILSQPDINGKKVRFTCKNLGPGIVYRFQLARDGGFLDMGEELLSPKPEISFIKPGEPGIYYARVAAVSPSGVEGPYSDVRTFRIVKGGLFRFICLIPAIALLLVLLL
ncbi:MAG: LysM peptidoglycan-binding domain-containing protein [Candidatus Aminicenantes bacterium]|nr:LysM peptidoglycan-binding domain-containing protein [Candidatus Aminicenantes bacterium]